MKKNIAPLILFIMCTGLLCCSQEKAEDSEILARINNYNLSLDTFQNQIAAEIEMDENFRVTKAAKDQFLERLIKKQLLVQEAKKLGLDRKKKFIRAIERYWESTLIRDLMDLKGKEISDKTYISENEIQTRYNEIKGSEETYPPIEKVREKIRKQLLENKKSRILSEWIDDLRQNADIEINDKLLYKD
jgi:hypothetical protein